MRLEHGYAQLSEVKLHYAEAGQGQLVMFLHSFPDFSYMWKDQILAVAPHARGLAPDLRGYNLSTKPTQTASYTLSKLVQDVLELALAFEEQNFVLVGHGWGGVIAWATAALHPEVVQKLVLFNAPHPRLLAQALKKKTFDGSLLEFLQHLEAESSLSLNDFERLRQSFLEPGFLKGYFNATEKKRYLNAWSRPGVLQGMLGSFRALGLKSELEFLANVGRITTQTHLFWGEDDLFIPQEVLLGLDDLVPHLKLERIPHRGHWIVQEDSAFANQKLLSILF